MESRNLATVAGRCVAAAIVVALVAYPIATFCSDGDRTRADFVIGNAAEPQSLDPAMASAIPEGRVARLLFEGLTVLDPANLAPLPGAAASWETSPDGLRWTFHLQPEGRWSDGSRVLAEDFVWSFLRLLRPETGARARSYLFDIAGARAFARGQSTDSRSVGVRSLDQSTLELTLERVSPNLLELLAFPATFPVSRACIESFGAAWTHPGKLVSNGPYRLESRRVRERIRVVRNPAYHGHARVALETIDVLAAESIGTLVNLYATGAVDWVADVPMSLVETLRRDQDAAFRTGPFYATYFYRLNTTRGPLRNVRIRAALDMGIDRDALVQRVLRGGEQPATTLVPPGRPGWRPGAHHPFDATAARALLEAGLRELGLTTLPALELTYNSLELHQSLAELVQREWLVNLGVRCTLARQESQSLNAAMDRLDYDVARSSWIADYLDPMTFLDVFTSEDANNRTGFRDATYDRLVQRDARATADPAERLRILGQAEDRLLDAHVVIPIYHYVAYNLIRPDVRGFSPNLMDVHFPQFLSRR